ncbi:probable G-protein coupled receptor 19 [Mya arenaria]|uniref:probable G-protein coupled receptor 19 n=1 Tax=Mya arenaria TaxID=6604 RepID=UPI0022E922CE|nr:probable G-protein coupled receptor 19 [Mya arenaria]
MTINYATPYNSAAMIRLTDDELVDMLNDEMRASVTAVSVFVGIEAVIGIFGNLLVLYVFLFRYRHCNFRYFVLCLACLDFTSTVTTMPGEIVTQQFWYTYPLPTVCKVKSFFNMFTVSGEALCLCVIAVDRHRKVCFPFGLQIRPRQALVLCFLIYASAFFIALPVAFLWGTHSDVVLYVGRNVTVTVCEKDMAYVNSNMPYNYTMSVEVILGTNMLIMLILYVLISRKILNRMIKKRKSPKEVSHIVMMTQTKTSKDNSDAGYASDAPRKVSKSASVSTINEVGSTGRNAGNTSDNTHAGYVTDNETTCSDVKKASIKRVERTTSRHKNKTPGLARRKTYISLVLTVIFILTTVLYLVLLTLITEGILETLTNTQKAFYFFGFRLVFINHVINPLVYGCMDPHFKQVLSEVKKCCRRSN